MQDTLLRVFVVALSLLIHPRDDPSVEEWDDNTTVGKQKHEERLLTRDKLDHEMAPVVEEVTYTDNKGPWDDKRTDSKEQNQFYQNIIEQDKMSDDVTFIKQEGNIAHHKLLEGQHPITLTKAEPENALKSSQTDREQMREDIQTVVSFSGPNKAQGQQNKPEENEGYNSKEQVTSLPDLFLRTSEKESSEGVISNWEQDYLWYIWNIFSIISMIRLFWTYLGRTFQNKQARPFPVNYTTAEVPLPSSDTLQQFHSKCIQVLSDNKWWEDAFLEGFANDLLDAMRTVRDQSDSVVIKDFQMVDVCNIIVPISPPDPYSFQCQLLDNQGYDLLDMHAIGQIKLVENKVQNGCPCQSSNADDMVCLLHCETEKVRMKTADICGGLCMKNSSFVSKSQVAKWFQSIIKQAWALISHKYEFELNIRYIDAPGALVIRFRSGKKINFTMNPVVKYDSDAYFFISPCSPSHLDTLWTLSLTKYEDRFLDYISKSLPENSCHSQTLEIAYFLYRKTNLSGSTCLKRQHFKIALMHLLMTKDSSQWKPNYVACRLRDLLDFMERSLERKLLHHVLIGNPFIQRVIELPAEFTQANPVNLFHPLVVHNCLYKSAAMHFQEILKNAHLLIDDYVGQCSLF